MGIFPNNWQGNNLRALGLRLKTAEIRRCVKLARHLHSMTGTGATRTGHIKPRKGSIMTSPISRIAGLATTACLALAILVGVIDAAQVSAHAAEAPSVSIAAFSVVTPAVGSLT
jgi:hypothetical protein